MALRFERSKCRAFVIASAAAKGIEGRCVPQISGGELERLQNGCDDRFTFLQLNLVARRRFISIDHHDDRVAVHAVAVDQHVTLPAVAADQEVLAPPVPAWAAQLDYDTGRPKSFLMTLRAMASRSFAGISFAMDSWR